MSLYADPQQHAANHPDTWQVVKVADRAWQVQDANGGVLVQARTRATAREAIESGPIRDLWEKEARWYASQAIPGWRPWSEIAATRPDPRPRTD